MDEGWAHHLLSDQVEAHSAGIETHGLNPDAVAIMTEAGVDISKHRSKHLDELAHLSFDHVITVCDHASEHCPVFPGNAHLIHKNFDDPPRLAKNARSRDEALSHYRRVRDEIRTFVTSLPEQLT